MASLHEMFKSVMASEQAKTAQSADADAAGGEQVDQEKVAMEKLAADIESAGALMADAFVDRVLETLAAKTAAFTGKGAVPTGRSTKRHSGLEEKSTWARVAKKVQGVHGAQSVDEDSGHTRAEDAFPRRIGKKTLPGGTGY